MHRIEGDYVDTSTGVNTFKTEPPLTVMTPEWATAVQEEMMYVITQSGLPVLDQAGDTKTQLWQAIRRIAQNWDYIVDSQETFVGVFTRVAANQYKINDDYKSVYFKIISGGYSIANVLSGGDTWGYIETNNCTHIEFENGAYIDMENTQGYIEINTNVCMLRNVDIRGANSVASAIEQSFLLNANYVTFDNCRTSSRLSNVNFKGFKGSGTALHNTTSKYINCSAYNLTSSDTCDGFAFTENMVNSLAYDIESTGLACRGIFDAKNISNARIFMLDGALNTNGVATGINLSNIYVEDIDSSGGEARGLANIDCLSSAYIFDIQSPVNNDVYGLKNSEEVSSIKINQLDTSGTGVVYGLHTCNQVSSVGIIDLDGASTVRGTFQSNQISSISITDLDSSGGTVYGMSTCNNISAFHINQITASANHIYGLYDCENSSSFIIQDVNTTGAGIAYGTALSQQMSACKIIDIDSTGDQAHGIYQGDNISAFYISDVLSGGSGAAFGLNDSDNCAGGTVEIITASGNVPTGVYTCNRISAIYVDDVDYTGAAGTDAYGFFNSDYMSAIYANDIDVAGAGSAEGYNNCQFVSSASSGETTNASNDYVDTVDAAIANKNSCHPTIWT